MRGVSGNSHTLQRGQFPATLTHRHMGQRVVYWFINFSNYSIHEDHSVSITPVRYKTCCSCCEGRVVYVSLREVSALKQYWTLQYQKLTEIEANWAEMDTHVTIAIRLHHIFMEYTHTLPHLSAGSVKPSSQSLSNGTDELSCVLLDRLILQILVEELCKLRLQLCLCMLILKFSLISQILLCTAL